MVPRSVGWFLLFLFLQGCSSTGVVGDAEVQARRHFALADSLERASALPKATLEYVFVAEHFPSASVYPRAVKKAALLLGTPSNPAADDSASTYWLGRSLIFAQSPEERQLIRMYIAMVDRATALRDSLHHQATALDSLTSLTRKQANEATSRARRVQELETELQQVSTELKKLKEIDIRISRNREKNKP